MFEYTDYNRREDFYWFKSNYDDLYAKYGHKFIAIQNKKILGVYNSHREAIDSRPEEIGTYIIQECNGDESGYTVYCGTIFIK